MTGAAFAFSGPSSLRAGLLLSGLALMAAKPSDAADGLEYSVRVRNPERQYVDVEIAIPRIRDASVTLAMPAWTPGSYKVRDHAKHVYDLRAIDEDGDRLELERVDKQRWTVHTDRKPFRVQYRVFADTLSVRTCYLDDRMALLNGACLFMYVDDDDAETRPATLAIDAPRSWQVHNALPTAGPVHRAETYTRLIDSPIVMGASVETHFRVADTRFDYVSVAPAGTNADHGRLRDDSRRIVAAFADMMGGLPTKHYQFYLILDPLGRGGGLEHFDSTAMILGSHAFDNDAAYLSAAQLSAHEFFHLWNVKRMHDQVLGPFDYARENYSDLLWFHEGFTNTMESKAVLRAKLWDPEAYVADIEKNWNRYMALPGRNHTPVAQLSRDAWIKGYQPAANYRNTAVSYYVKGDLIGLALDLELRLRSARGGRSGSLEGLFRRLWSSRKEGADERPLTIDDIRAAATAEAGESMDWFFERFVYDREEIELPRLLARMGIETRQRLAWQNDEGEDDPKLARSRPWIGVVGRGSRITSVDPGSPAARSGLMIDDEIIAIDDRRVDDLDAALSRIADRHVGDRIELALFRRGRLVRKRLRVGQNPYTTWTFRVPKPEDRSTGLRDWLQQPDAATTRTQE